MNRYQSCPMCESEELKASELKTAYVKNHPLWQEGLPEEITWLQCRDCGHVFTREHFEEEELRLLFSRGLLYQTAISSPEQARMGWSPLVATVTKLSTSQTRQWIDVGSGSGACGGCVMTSKTTPHRQWIDVGSGSGALLMMVEEYGWEATGIEVREAAAQESRRLGLKVYSDSAGTYGLPDEYDVVSMCDLLEHMALPISVLRSVCEGVRPGGLLIISTPTRDSMSWRVMEHRGENPYWGELEHHHCFSEKQLVEKMKALGFFCTYRAPSGRYLAGTDLIFTRELP